MKRIHVVGLAGIGLSFGLLFSASSAQAQRGGRMSGPATIGRGVSLRGGRARVANNALPPGFNFSGTPVFFPNASRTDIGTEAAIDPATQWRLFERNRFGRNRGFFGGGFLWGGGAEYDVPGDYYDDSDQPPQPYQPYQPAPQAPIVIVQQAPDAHPPVAESADAPAANAPPTLPDAGPFTLVLKNGDKVEAVAFTRQDDSIVYITPDGRRRTLARSDIDLDSTARVNEERGTPLPSSL